MARENVRPITTWGVFYTRTLSMLTLYPRSVR